MSNQNNSKKNQGKFHLLALLFIPIVMVTAAFAPWWVTILVVFAIGTISYLFLRA